MKRLRAGEGLDVVYNSVGHATFRKGFDFLKPRGLGPAQVEKALAPAP